MRGLKLFTTTALAVNKDSVDRPQSKSLQKDGPIVQEDRAFGRRKALQNILSAGAVVAAAPKTAFGLDMDAFANSQIEADVKNCDPKRDPKCIPKLNADEALCKYGQAGDARGEACKRVKKAGGALPSVTKEKSLGGAYAM